MDIGEILAQARLPERTITICLRGDLQAEFEELERAHTTATEQSGDSLAESGDARDIAEQIETVRAQMRKHEVTFKFRALSARAYSDLLAEHPPTEQQKEQRQELNWDTFPSALISACCTDPAMSVEQAQQLSEGITHRQWDDLFACAFAVNRREVDIPFSLAASATLADTAPKSKPRGRGVSRGAGSSDGNLAK